MKFKINFYKIKENFCKSFYETCMKIAMEHRINCKGFQVNLEDNENFDRTSYKLIRLDFTIIPSSTSTSRLTLLNRLTPNRFVLLVKMTVVNINSGKFFPWKIYSEKQLFGKLDCGKYPTVICIRKNWFRSKGYSKK